MRQVASGTGGTLAGPGTRRLHERMLSARLIEEPTNADPPR
jgi:hypothetical protein